jgi:hypothetical protein
MKWQDFFLSDPYEGAKLVPLDLQGWASDDAILEACIKNTQPKLIIEVGSWKGASAIHMAKVCKRLGLDTKILCVDTWLGGVETYQMHDGINRWIHESLRHQAGYPRLHETFMSNVIREGFKDAILPLPLPSTVAAEVIRHRGIEAEFIYIDGSHEYDDVVLDLKGYWKLTKNGGIMGGDDYLSWPGVTRAVDEFVQQEGRPSVRRDRKFAISKGASLEGVV